MATKKKLTWNIPVMERFWLQVKKTRTCWLWVGADVGRDKRGCLRVNGKSVYVHRFSFSQFNGPIPPGLCVLHTCDVPHCVNPQHLFLGTHSDNMKDAYRKGRKTNVGVKNPNCKLTPKIVRQIRKHYPKKTGDAIALEFDVSRSLVYQILRGDLWGHLT